MCLAKRPGTEEWFMLFRCVFRPHLLEVKLRIIRAKDTNNLSSRVWLTNLCKIRIDPNLLSKSKLLFSRFWNRPEIFFFFSFLSASPILDLARDWNRKYHSFRETASVTCLHGLLQECPLWSQASSCHFSQGRDPILLPLDWGFNLQSPFTHCDSPQAAITKSQHLSPPQSLLSL